MNLFFLSKTAENYKKILFTYLSLSYKIPLAIALVFSVINQTNPVEAAEREIYSSALPNSKIEVAEEGISFDFENSQQAQPLFSTLSQPDDLLSLKQPYKLVISDIATTENSYYRQTLNLKSQVVAQQNLHLLDKENQTSLPIEEPEILKLDEQKPNSCSSIPVLGSTSDCGIPLREASALLQTPLHSTTPQIPKVDQKNYRIHKIIGASPEEQITSNEEVEKVLDELRSIEKTKIQPLFYSPSLSIYVPTGFGSDKNTVFASVSYQPRGRFSNDDDLGAGIGVGLGDAWKSVGVELSYTFASFGRNRDFGSGGFNAKVHRQFPGDWSLAVGWNGFINVGDANSFEQSVYGVATKIFRTQDNLNSPFSRVALTVGVGSGQFRTEDAVANGDDNINIFGNIAVRVAKPASFIVEWSGQDLGIGVSVIPFHNIPFVITPALRDITGAGDGTRFVLGTAFSFQF
ncbi:hypothetical protein [Nostoc sp. PCC 7107]|uniref:hypothetical protein n=1 Tax=Nostoc sp. PCC 7107 TaxID=317936 RepID=UPI00029F36E4|nr:hypothetical protein [Nostoc sp. PCC 7107]AFY43908.1 hypothetical protein Nos7107_3328 [Nostoc sp. PCC 7107]